jgi:hypothetical protein
MVGVSTRRRACSVANRCELDGAVGVAVHVAGEARHTLRRIVRDAVMGGVEPGGLERGHQQPQAVELLGAEDAVEHVEVVGVGDLDAARHVAHLGVRAGTGRAETRRVAVGCRSRRRNARAPGGRASTAPGTAYGRWIAAGGRAVSRGRPRRRECRPEPSQHTLPSWRRRWAVAPSAHRQRLPRHIVALASVVQSSRKRPSTARGAIHLGALLRHLRLPVGEGDTQVRAKELRLPPPNWNSPPGGFVRRAAPADRPADRCALPAGARRRCPTDCHSPGSGAVGRLPQRVRRAQSQRRA